MSTAPAILANESNSNLVDHSSQDKTSIKCHESGALNKSSGLYDAEKCRNYIASQIKVNKIDRFASQVDRALEIESSFETRIRNLQNMYTKCSASGVHNFIQNCKLGLLRHRQDRILYNKRKRQQYTVTNQRGNQQTRNEKSVDFPSISNDLLYGPGAQLVHSMLIQASCQRVQAKSHPNRKKKLAVGFDEIAGSTVENSSSNFIPLNQDEDHSLYDNFDPKLYVQNLENDIRLSLDKSKILMEKLNLLRQLFEKFALEHRAKVDRVYAAEEERQAQIVTRRSTYNLSMSAIKATTMPVHISGNTHSMPSECSNGESGEDRNEGYC